MVDRGSIEASSIRSRQSLERDEGCYRYFIDPLPVLPDGVSGTLVIKTSFERAVEAEKAAG